MDVGSVRCGLVTWHLIVRLRRFSIGNRSKLRGELKNLGYFGSPEIIALETHMHWRIHWKPLTRLEINIARNS